MNNLLNMKKLKKREEYQAEFDKIARKLLNSYQLKAPKNYYLIREIEFYYHTENHTDFYCHNNDKQLNNSTFYFHRFNDPEKYLQLRRKGIDITFGNKENDCHGGILIRAIQDIDSGKVLTGIGILTNQIIDDIGGVDEIHKLCDPNYDVFDKNSSLHLLCSDNNQLKIFKKCRQGLNQKSSDLDKFYLNAAYNYFTYPEISELI